MVQLRTPFGAAYIRRSAVIGVSAEYADLDRSQTKCRDLYLAGGQLVQILDEPKNMELVLGWS